MPVKLPAPDAGTDEHAGPNGAAIADALGEDDAGMDEDEDGADAAVLDPLEPHAAAPSARPAVAAAIAANLYITGTPLVETD
jgi:hypothetical protein